MMMKYRLLYTGSDESDFLGFDTKQEALLWAVRQERQGLIKAQKLMEFDKDNKSYKEIMDLSNGPVDLDLPYADQNKIYSLSYIQNKVNYEVFVQAPAPKVAERFFLCKESKARSISTKEVDLANIAPYTPIFVLTEQEQKEYRADLLFSKIEELDFTVRTYNTLRRADIETVADLICHSKSDLMSFRNMGWKSLDEIESILTSHGESLLPDEETALKPTLDSRIRSVANYAEKKKVKEAVQESDKLRNMALDACYKIPGYDLLPPKDKNKLYDVVKTSISLSLTKEDRKEKTAVVGER